jgi:hypothetical protein
MLMIHKGAFCDPIVALFISSLLQDSGSAVYHQPPYSCSKAVASKKPHFLHQPDITVTSNKVGKRLMKPGCSAENVCNYA